MRVQLTKRRTAAGLALLFAAAKLAIGIYLGRAGVASAYGAAGSIVVIMVWVYFSAQIFLFAAELARAIDRANENT